MTRTALPEWEGALCQGTQESRVPLHVHMSSVKVKPWHHKDRALKAQSLYMRV
jgi:hypothetical protein